MFMALMSINVTIMSYSGIHTLKLLVCEIFLSKILFKKKYFPWKAINRSENISVNAGAFNIAYNIVGTLEYNTPCFSNGNYGR